jgi:Outer membrane protein and related peptidoglycan-associated (lipo)proteins
MKKLIFLLSTVSRGKEKPLDPGHNENAWAENRRVDFNVAGEILGEQVNPPEIWIIGIMTALTPTFITRGGIMIHGGGILIGGEDSASVIMAVIIGEIEIMVCTM